MPSFAEIGPPVRTSVSPSPKKGHGKVAKICHFLTRGNMSKGHFQRVTASKRGTFKWPMA